MNINFQTLGLILIVAGILLFLGLKIPYLGNMPGDLSYQTKGGRIFLPITSCIIISIILSVILRIFTK